MFCFISTPSVGYLYSIDSSFHLISTYHYAAAVAQVLLLFVYYILCLLYILQVAVCARVLLPCDTWFAGK